MRNVDQNLLSCVSPLVGVVIRQGFMDELLWIQRSKSDFLEYDKNLQPPQMDGSEKHCSEISFCMSPLVSVTSDEILIKCCGAV